MTEQKWTSDIAKFLIGKSIAGVRYMSQEEVDENMWDQRPLAIFFTDGSYIIPMSDDEGNNGGSLYTSSTDLPIIPVM